MILYTHFNEHLKMDGLPNDLTKNLSYLKKKNIEGHVFMATTSRLLKYKEVHNHLIFKVDSNDKETNIYINSILDTPIGAKTLEKGQLSGLTFYVEHPPTTQIWFKDTELESKINPPDETGIPSVMIPWKKLPYPR